MWSLPSLVLSRGGSDFCGCKHVKESGSEGLCDVIHISIGDLLWKKYRSFQNECCLLLPIFFSSLALLSWRLLFKLLINFLPRLANFFWIQKYLSMLFIGVMIWILVVIRPWLFFRIPRKWLWYSILTVLVVGAPDSLTFRQLNMSSSNCWRLGCIDWL